MTTYDEGILYAARIKPEEIIFADRTPEEPRQHSTLPLAVCVGLGVFVAAWLMGWGLRWLGGGW